MSVTKLKRLIGVKNRVNYVSGLWLNINLSAGSFNEAHIYVNDKLMVKRSVNGYEKGEQVVLDFYLPVNLVAKAIEGIDKTKIEVISENNKTLIRHTCDSKAIYQKELEHIGEDINFTLSCLPLLNEKSISTLNEVAKLTVIKHLFEVKLEKDASDLLLTIIGSLNDFHSAKDSEVLQSLKWNKEFLTLLVNQHTPVISNPYYVYIKQALKAMMYLDAKAIIEHSAIDDADKSHLHKECVQGDETKFSFVEHLPAEESEALQLWEQLSDAKKTDYWPMLAVSFCYRRQYMRFEHYPVNLEWFTDMSHGQRDKGIKAIIQAPNTKWFGLSLIVSEWHNGASIANTLEHLQEYVWANWNEEYVNVDVFCYVMGEMLSRGLAREHYNSAIDMVLDLINSRLNNNANDIYRQSFIELNTALVNHGIKTANWAFGKLAEKVRPYYSFDDYYLANVNYQATQAFDGDYYRFVDAIFSKTKALKTFFANLEHNKAPDVEMLRKQFADLEFLRSHNIQGVDKWILALSRYCQLLEVEELYFELAKLHEAVGDTYGALVLTHDLVERARLEQLINTHGNHSKRKDSYWFERAIESRATRQRANRIDMMSELAAFLTGSREQQQYYSDDLLQLLASEATHYVLQGGKVSDVEPFLPLLSQAYVAGHSAVYVTNWLVNQEVNLTTMNSVASLCGEYGEFKWFIDELGVSAHSVLTDKGQSLLLKGIKQQYVYPYIQVMIYSCNAYQNTRHKIIRDSWLPTLTALDIDYCFVVGDAEQSHMDGDIMRLAVPDTYEALPQKSVEMFRFGHQNSRHRYYYKLDDDCVLNVHAMFGDPAFLNQAYFGRTVQRPLGGVDRSWHHKKSTTQQAKTSLDLSPEYSAYCDGSTGYIVSRWGAEQLTEQAELDNNIQLISSSYFEDKLVGDLMAKAKVPFTDIGYNCVIRRKAAAGRDLQMWDYGLLPMKGNNIKVLHTEDDVFRAGIGAKVTEQYQNLPKLLYRDAVEVLNPDWLSAQEQAPVLEKISVDEASIRHAKHIAIIVGKNEQELLPNLLKHHRSIGVEHFLFVDNCSEDASIDYMLEQPDVSVFVATQEYRHSRFAVNWQETLLSHYGLGRWVLIIDSDELYTYSESENKTLHTITQQAERENANGFFAPMVDFYPQGDLAVADVTGDSQFYQVCDHYDSLESMQVDAMPVYGPYSNAPTYQGGLRARIFGSYNSFPQPNYVNQKYNLLKYEPNMRLIEGLHYMYGTRVSKVAAAIMHFKYHAGFYAKVVREINSGQHWNGATEYKRYAKALESKQSNVLFDEKVSQQYIDSTTLLNFEMVK